MGESWEHNFAEIRRYDMDLSTWKTYIAKRCEIRKSEEALSKIGEAAQVCRWKLVEEATARDEDLTANLKALKLESKNAGC